MIDPVTKKCKGCKHCTIPKRMVEDIKTFKPVAGPYSVRYKVIGLCNIRRINE